MPQRGASRGESGPAGTGPGNPLDVRARLGVQGFDLGCVVFRYYVALHLE